ncbi:ABC transporter permease [Neobacillus drentensis]|uniref:ABC transporter permease n=1 Tax=Neobacillus drentensis TaxID=220684 RepID=UPI002FFF9046
MKKITQQKEFGIGLVVIILGVILTVMSPAFFTTGNILDILKANSVLGILAVGMTLVIITGGIDNSVAAMTAAVTVVISKLVVVMGSGTLSLLTVFVIAILVGACFGLINGILIAVTKIPPIVTSLGTMTIISGITLYISNGEYVNSSMLPAKFIAFADYKIGGVSILIFIFLITAIFTWFLLKYLTVGRDILSFGGNPTSAMRVGINTTKVQIFVYTYMGLLAGIAGIVQTAYNKGVDPNGFSGFELTVIAAVVLGGANIMGGSGSILGTLLGTLLLGIMQNGLILAKINTFWQEVFVGLIILIAVSYEVLKRKREEMKLSKVEIEV